MTISVKCPAGQLALILFFIKELSGAAGRKCSLHSSPPALSTFCPDALRQLGRRVDHVGVVVVPDADGVEGDVELIGMS